MPASPAKSPSRERKLSTIPAEYGAGPIPLQTNAGSAVQELPELPRPAAAQSSPTVTPVHVVVGAGTLVAPGPRKFYECLPSATASPAIPPTTFLPIQPARISTLPVRASAGTPKQCSGSQAAETPLDP